MKNSFPTMNKVLLLCLIASLVLSFSLDFLYNFGYTEDSEDNFSDQIHIVIDGQLLKTPGRLYEGKTMVPLRGVFEQSSAHVHWNEETQEITINKDWDIVELTPEEPTAVYNYEDEITLEQSPLLIRGTTWLPLRTLMELFDLEVDWKGEHNLVKITTEDTEETTSMEDILDQIEQLDLRRADKDDKVIYLTFDDGPSSLTPEILDLLDEYDAKATFFVIGQKAEARPEIIRSIRNRGHLIGNHSYTHDYEKVYDSPESFEQELIKTEDIIHSITGERTSIFRPPGGAHPNITEEYEEILSDHDYIMYNWNVSGGDTATPTPQAEVIKQNVVRGVYESTVPVVLLHDLPGNDNTKEALADILQQLSFEGYQFNTLPH